MKTQTTITAIIHLTNNEGITGAIQQKWNKNELAEFLMLIDDEVSISCEANYIQFVINEYDFSNICKNLKNYANNI